MNLKNDEVTLTQRFSSQFATLYPSVPVDYPGTKTDPVNGEIVRFKVVHAPSVNTALGAGRRRNFGSALIQIVVPMGNGQGRLLEIADAVSSVFNKYRSGGLWCRAASFSGPFEDGAFIMGTVDVPYISDYSA